MGEKRFGISGYGGSGIPSVTSAATSDSSPLAKGEPVDGGASGMPHPAEAGSVGLAPAETGDAVMMAAVNAALEKVVAPLVASLAEMMRNNTEALQYLAAQQKVQTDRMEALERQIRLNTLVSPVQARYLNDAIRRRSRDILAKNALDGDKKAVTRLSAAIRKAVIARYGVAALNEVPRHEYNVAMEQIGTWNDALAILDVTRAAREAMQNAR